MAADNEHSPGTPAPVTGNYQELNVFGTPTGRVHQAHEGEPLPKAPRGFLWRQVRREDG